VRRARGGNGVTDADRGKGDSSRRLPSITTVNQAILQVRVLPSTALLADRKGVTMKLKYLYRGMDYPTSGYSDNPEKEITETLYMDCHGDWHIVQIDSEGITTVLYEGINPEEISIYVTCKKEK
jgi:hypothetical protein